MAWIQVIRVVTCICTSFLSMSMRSSPSWPAAVMRGSVAEGSGWEMWLLLLLWWWWALMSEPRLAAEMLRGNEGCSFSSLGWLGETGKSIKRVRRRTSVCRGCCSGLWKGAGVGEPGECDGVKKKRKGRGGRARAQDEHQMLFLQHGKVNSTPILITSVEHKQPNTLGSCC